MFKNRSMQVKMIKDKKEPVEKVEVDLEKILLANYLLKDQIQNAAIFVGGAIVALKLINTAGSIAVIKTQASAYAKAYPTTPLS